MGFNSFANASSKSASTSARRCSTAALATLWLPLMTYFNSSRSTFVGTGLGTG